MEKKKNKREKNIIREYFELIVETAIFVFFVITFVIQAFQIPTGSMEPSLLVGDFLLVNKLAYAGQLGGLGRSLLPARDLQRHDIVVFKYPNDLTKDFVKRVVAFERETIEIKDKQVLINDEPIEEMFKVHTDDKVYSPGEYYPFDDVIRDNFGPVKVPKGYCFVMGDNRDSSMDSRYWGFLPLEHIKGRPWLIYFSYRAEKDAYLKTSLRERLSKLAQYLPKARWQRLFKVIR